MSPLATNIEEEGVYIDNFKLVDGGIFRERKTYELLTSGRYPARNPDQNIADPRQAGNCVGLTEGGL